MVQINFAHKEIQCKIVYYGPGMSGKTTTAGTPVATTDKSKMTPQQRMKACGSEWNAMSAADKAKTTYKAFSSTCLKKT